MTHLAAKLERLYGAFDSIPKPRRIEGCPCCHSEAHLCALLNTPLRSVTPDQLSNYAASALLTAGSERDLHYFFPRILEATIQDPDWWPNREVVLGKLALANWTAWPSSERVAITDAVMASFVLEVGRGAAQAWGIDGWLCGLALAGVELEPFLMHLSLPGNDEIVLSLYELNSSSLMKGKLNNSFWQDHRALQAPIIAWFKSEPTQATIDRAQKVRYGEHDA